MAEDTYVESKKLIRESKLFTSGEAFLTRELVEETGLVYDFLTQVLGQMVQSGQISKKQVKKPNKKGGIEYHYKKQTVLPKDFLGMQLRRHSNEQLGLEAEYCWAVL